MNPSTDFKKCWCIVILKDYSFHLSLQIQLFRCYHFSPAIPKSISSHQNASCFCHYIGDRLLTWCLATFTHSLLTLFSLSSDSLLTLFSLSSHSLLTLFSLSSHSLLTLFSFSSHSLLTLFSLSTHSLLTLFSLSSHSCCRFDNKAPCMFTISSYHHKH